MKFKRILILFVIAFLAAIILPACAGANKDDEQDVVEPIAQPDQLQTFSLWLPPYLPRQMTGEIDLTDQINLVDDQADADLVLDVGADYLLTEWIYVLAAPFPTVADGVSSSDLQSLWNGEAIENFPVEKILVDGSTKLVFEKLWGSGSLSTVDVVSEGELLSTAWDNEKTWALIPFEMLEPQWKVIALDGQSPIQKSFNASAYALKIPFSVVGDVDKAKIFFNEYGLDSTQSILPASNRVADKLTTVVLTGVTALVRGTAYLMEANGMTYPAIDIGDLLRYADILHISNEIPFTETCPSPFQNTANDANLVFCSKPEYIRLLEAIGTDVVELTGDHFRDWGADAMLFTIDMYNQRGWKYYGGGINLSDGMKPALFEHNGNKIAFIGCNAKPPGYATASLTSPGAVHCDMDAMAEVIKDVAADGYLPVFTFQHLEYYAYTADDNLVADFRNVADAGAIIVSGSQAHQPHALEFYKGATIHYGLGNLFFDQYEEGFPKRQAFIDRHVFYDGNYISTELITIMFLDMARPRLMTAKEREQLLNTVFAAGGW